MTFAGYYVIERLLKLIDEGKTEESRELFEKITQRYPKDSEMKRLHSEFEEYMILEKPQKLENIRKDLDALKIIRKVHSEKREDFI